LSGKLGFSPVPEGAASSFASRSKANRAGRCVVQKSKFRTGCRFGRTTTQLPEKSGVNGGFPPISAFDGVVSNVAKGAPAAV
jgi:hypothetical protein